MKTFQLLFMILIFVGLLAGCSKDDELVDQNNDLMLKKVSMAPVFVVEPNGTDDTQALQEAFDAAILAGPGAVVQLCEGEYHLGFLQVYGFEGCLTGAGKDKTILTAMNNLDMQALWDQNMRGDLIKFVGGNVHLSQFTVQTPPGKLTVSGTTDGHIAALINFSAHNVFYEPDNENSSIDVVIDNVQLIGQTLTEADWGYNCIYGIRTGWDWAYPDNLPREKINFRITCSEFDSFVSIMELDGMIDSKIVIGENGHGNVFANSIYCGGVYESRNMNILVEGNTFNIPYSSYGFELDVNSPWYTGILKDQPQTMATICNVQNNDFNLAQAFCGLWLKDYRRQTNPEEMPVLMQVKNNHFLLTENWGRAIRCRWTKGTVIRNNKIEGQGAWGIQIDSPGGKVHCENGLLLGNNFASAELNNGSVQLSADTENWTLVGGDLGETVVNNGINNMITGFNNQTSEVPPGQTIVDNLDEMRPLLHNVK